MCEKYTIERVDATDWKTIIAFLEKKHGVEKVAAWIERLSEDQVAVEQSNRKGIDESTT